MQTWNLALRLNSQNNHQMTTAMDCNMNQLQHDKIKKTIFYTNLFYININVNMMNIRNILTLTMREYQDPLKARGAIWRIGENHL